MGAGVIMVSRAIADAGHPEIELVRGKGYHYFVFDNTKTKARSEGLIYETESVMEPRFHDYPFDRWVKDGIEFAERVKAAYRGD